jgi:hypothetical protein
MMSYPFYYKPDCFTVRMTQNKDKEIVSDFSKLVNKTNVVCRHSLVEALHSILETLDTYALFYEGEEYGVVSQAVKHTKIGSFYYTSVFKGDNQLYYKFSQEEIDEATKCNYLKVRVTYSSYDGIIRRTYRDDDRFDLNIIITDYESLYSLNQFPQPENNEIYVGSFDKIGSESLAFAYIIGSYTDKISQGHNLSVVANKWMLRQKLLPNKLPDHVSTLVGIMYSKVDILCAHPKYITFVDNEYTNLNKLPVKYKEHRRCFGDSMLVLKTIDTSKPKLLSPLKSYFDRCEPHRQHEVFNTRQLGIKLTVEDIKQSI